MFWKLTGLQKLLDALFEGSWFDFGLPESADCTDGAVFE
jgi:hypothetical protein